MGLQEVGWEMDWICVAQNRRRFRDIVNAVMKLRIRRRYEGASNWGYLALVYIKCRIIFD